MKHSLFSRPITALRIRQAVESCPDGLCFAAPDGRPILTNRSFNRMLLALTGHTVTNAIQMWKELEAHALEGVEPGAPLLLRLPDGTVWQAGRKPLSTENGPYIQYESADITELYQNRERLREQNQQVSALHRRQRELLTQIVQNNLEQELLSAKLRIHDELGQLLMLTRQALESPEAADVPAICAGWENAVTDLENATLGQSQRRPSPQEELVKVSRLIGCRLEMTGPQPTERKALLLLYAAIREALTNAVRHADAHLLTVQLSQSARSYRAEIGSDGTPAPDVIREGSGLTGLRQRLEREGATLCYRNDPALTMIVTIPKE